MNKTVLLIIDNQPIFRAGVRRALAQEEGLESLEILDCDPGQDGEEAIRQIADNSPNVAIFDIKCPVINGLELIRRIAQYFPKTKVIALSADYNADELYEVAKTGAAAYLSRDSSTPELAAAMRRAASGDCPINDTYIEKQHGAERVLDQIREMTSRIPDPVTAKEDIITPLTPKEVQFLNLIAEDNSNGGIATILGITDKELKSCVNAILRKLNASDRAHAVMLELCNNWLSLHEGEEATSLTLQMSEVSVKKSNNGSRKNHTKAAIKTPRSNSSKSQKSKTATGRS